MCRKVQLKQDQLAQSQRIKYNLWNFILRDFVEFYKKTLTYLKTRKQLFIWLIEVVSLGKALSVKIHSGKLIC
jgi:hypothetical protein